MDIAIIGGGLCGLAVAWHLLNHNPTLKNLSVHIFDGKGIGKGASGIASGLMHPFGGAHAKLNRRGKEGFEATFELLDVASKALRRPVISPSNGILRLALNQEQFADFQQCAKQYPDQTEWLDFRECQNLAPGCLQVPGLWIKQGLTIFTSSYLEGLWKACLHLGLKYEQRHIKSLKEMGNFDITIVACGGESIDIPELASLKLTKVKGQLLEIKWPEGIPFITCSLNSHVYLLMSESRSSCLVGSTYERDFTDSTISIKRAKEEILPKVYELFPPLKNAFILNCYAGIRAVTPNHLPLIHRLSSSQWILTGMGSKGLLYHALYARELVAKIWEEWSKNTS